MGTARGSVVLRRIRNTGMLSMQLFTEGGRPLKQTVTGNMVNDDWTQEGNHPKVYPLAQYSRYSDFISEFVSVEWRYDGVLISDSDERFDLTQTPGQREDQIRLPPFFQCGLPPQRGAFSGRGAQALPGALPRG